MGSFLGFAGLSASVFVSKSNIEILYFTAGFLLGLGIGLVYIPIVVGINFYFVKRRSLANGIVKCGSGFGTFVFAPLVRLLLDNYGVRGALLVLVITWKIFKFQRSNNLLMIFFFLILIKGALFLNCAVCGWLLFPLKPQRRNKRTTSTVEGAEQSLSNHIPVPAALNRDKQKVKKNENEMSRVILLP